MSVKRRWILRLLLAAVALVLLLLLAVQVVLWTDLPRQWVLGAIQEKLQLRVGAQHFTTGWDGRTALSGVNLTLPLAQEAFLETPRLSVEHTGLLGLILGRSLRVESIVIERPNLLVRQQPDGRWNLEEVAELIRRAGGGKTADTQGEPKTVTGAPQLPRVSVRDAVVRLVDVRGRQATIAPVSIEGKPDGPLVWRYEASIPDHVQLSGEIAPGVNWQHEATIRLHNLGPWVQPFLIDPSAATLETLQRFKLEGHWTARVAGSLTGRMDLTELMVGGYTATGPVGVAIDRSDGGGVTMISPAGVTITSPFKKQVPEARVTAGTIALDGKSITARNLSLAFAGGEVRLGGSYVWNGGQAGTEVFWNNLVLPQGTVHSGSMTASLRQPWPNQPVIDVTLNTAGRRGVDRWKAQLTLAGKGRAWDQIDWTLSAPALDYQMPQQGYNLDQLHARLSTRGNLLTLHELSLPPGELYRNWRRGTLAAQGSYDLVQGNWDLFLTGNDWPVSPAGNTTAAAAAAAAPPPPPANFMINAWGDRAWARLGELFAEGAGIQIWANGDISYLAKGMPAELNLYGWYPPLEYTWHEQGGEAANDVKMSGRLSSELHLTKGAWPINLDIHGTLYAKEFQMKDHPVGDVALKLDGFADPEHLKLGTSRLELLGGIWGLDADYRYEPRLTRLEVKLQELSLAELDNFAHPPPNIRGTVSGRWVVHLPEFDVNRMRLEGDYSVHDLGRLNPPPPTTAPALAGALDQRGNLATTTMATATTPTTTSRPAVPLAYATTTLTATAATSRPSTIPATQPSITPLADAIEGRVIVRRGLVTLDPILMKRKQGETRALVSFPFTAPRHMHIEATTAAWPLELLDSETRQTSDILLWGQTPGLDLDLKQLTAAGPLDLRASIARKARTVANLTIRSSILGRRLDVKSITGEGLGGRITGDGYIYLDDPLQSAGRIDWQNVDSESITALLPFTRGLEGHYTGSVRFSPSDLKLDRDASGPFAISGSVTTTDGKWKGIDIGNATFVAHAGDQRAVLDKLDWHIAGGTLNGWTRVTWYREPFVHVNLSFKQLSLDQIVRAARPAGQEHKPIPGLLEGTAVLAGNPNSQSHRNDASGDVRVRITESDLANVSFVNTLYSVMSVKIGPPQPTGHGHALARLEGSRLEIPSVRYFNRGVDIWASATVLDVFKGAQSPIEGSAAGSARPLKDLKLPFMADVDQIFAALQGAVATASIEGTVGDPTPRVIPFAQSGESFRRFMIGEVKNEVRGTAGR